MEGLIDAVAEQVGVPMRIGDPSGRSAERPILSDAEIDANAQTYQEQAFYILDDDPAKLDLSDGREVVLYCRSGRRSAIAGEKLAAATGATANDSGGSVSVQRVVPRPALSRWPVLSALVLVISGAAWMLAIALFNIAVQLSAPRWVARSPRSTRTGSGRTASA